MAARRLLIVMVVLLVLSSLAAALVPPPPRSSTTTESSTTSTATQSTTAEPSSQTGQGVARRIDASNQKPRRLVLAQNDQLSLTVVSPHFTEVEIPELGLLDVAEPNAAAHFDILLSQPGAYAVRARESRRVIARLIVRAPPLHSHPGGSA